MFTIFLGVLDFHQYKHAHKRSGMARQHKSLTPPTFGRLMIGIGCLVLIALPTFRLSASAFSSMIPTLVSTKIATALSTEATWTRTLIHANTSFRSRRGALLINIRSSFGKSQIRLKNKGLRSGKESGIEWDL